MRKLSLCVLLALAACSKGGGAAGGGEPAVTLATEDDKTFYALGLAIGRNMTDFKLTEPQLAIVKKGISDHVMGKTPEVDLQAYLPKISEKARAGQAGRMEEERKKAEVALGPEKEKGKAFLEKAAAEKGAQKLESGLIYQEITAGTGPTPAASDTVKVHYKGTLIDGKEFDSSYSRGQPATFPLSGVIKCWTEGVQKIKVGGKAKLLCPSDIAYGDRGSPPNIPGGATLVFEVELLEIVKG